MPSLGITKTAKFMTSKKKKMTASCGSVQTCGRYSKGGFICPLKQEKNVKISPPQPSSIQPCKKKMCLEKKNNTGPPELVAKIGTVYTKTKLSYSRDSQKGVGQNVARVQGRFHDAAIGWRLSGICYQVPGNTNKQPPRHVKLAVYRCASSLLQTLTCVRDFLGEVFVEAKGVVELPALSIPLVVSSYGSTLLLVGGNIHKQSEPNMVRDHRGMHGFWVPYRRL